MLVYVRDTEAPEILAPVQEDVIPRHIGNKLREEQETKARLKKEKAEAHLYIDIKVRFVSFRFILTIE